MRSRLNREIEWPHIPEERVPELRSEKVRDHLAQQALQPHVEVDPLPAAAGAEVEARQSSPRLRHQLGHTATVASR